jgi:hypothetical protein
LVGDVLETSGYKHQLKQYPNLLLEISNRVLMRQNIAVENEKLKSSIDTIASFENLYKTTSTELKNNSAADANYLKSIIDSYKSPLIAKIVALEVQAATPDMQKALQAYLLDAKTVAVDPERQALINGLISAKRAAKDYADTAAVIAQNVYAIIVRGSREDEEKFSQQIRQEFSTQAQAVLPLQYQFIYRDINNAELKQYIEFYNKEDIQKYIALTQVISEKLLANAVKQIIPQALSSSAEKKPK